MQAPLNKREQAWTSVNKREKATNKEAFERIPTVAHL